jgi:hypothetical protein
MADIQKRVTSGGEARWEVRYRDDSPRQHKRSFDRKLNVQRFARSVEPDLPRGDWIDLRRGQQRSRSGPPHGWRRSATASPRPRESSESIVNRHRLPRFAAAPIAAIDYLRVLAFVADLQRAGTGPETMRNIRDVLRLLAFAVRSGALKSTRLPLLTSGRCSSTRWDACRMSSRRAP